MKADSMHASAAFAAVAPVLPDSVVAPAVSQRTKAKAAVVCSSL